MTIVESMNTSRSKSKVVSVKINDLSKVNNVPYLSFGLLAVVYGVAIFVLLPVALVNS